MGQVAWGPGSRPPPPDRRDGRDPESASRAV